MYIMNVEYCIGDEIKQASHKVLECYDHVSKDDSSCRMLLPKEADASAYENVALNQGKITKLTLLNDQNEELYVSTHWTSVAHVQKTFNAEGYINREVVLNF